MIIYAPDSLRTQVEAATGGRVTVLYDDTGAPSYMHVIPKFRYEDLGLDGVLGTGVATAFSVGGVEKNEIFIGQYLASVYDGRAVSLPGRAPRNEISFLDAKASCVNKGAGWHLMTAHEWAAIALWCKVNGHMPRGNTNSGRAHDARHETGIIIEGGSITATGSGPVSWRHDNTTTGIADLVGNLSEWNDLLKVVDGQLFATHDNDFTTNVLDGLDHYFKRVDDPPTLMLQNAPPPELSGWSSLASFAAMTKSPDYIESQLLQRLLVSATPSTAMPGFVLSQNISGETMAARGGFYLDEHTAGLGMVTFQTPPTQPATYHGFRPAFIA